MKMNPLIIIGIVLVVVIAGLWAYDRLFDRQQVIDPTAYPNVRFPEVRGTSLSGEEFNLPGDIGAEYALIMIAFQQYQQVEINTWLPLARELADRYPQLVYFEFPTIDRLNAAARAFIDGGMRAGIPDPVARATTITLYLDRSAFREVLDIQGEDQIVVMLINQDGEVFWRTEGPATDNSLEEVDSILQDILV
jgi:hypothetical protein